MSTKKSGIISAIKNGTKSLSNSIITVISFIYDKLFLLVPLVGILFIIIDINSSFIKLDYGRWITVILLLIYLELKLYIQSKRKAKCCNGGIKK